MKMKIINENKNEIYNKIKTNNSIRNKQTRNGHLKKRNRTEVAC